jgi:hypothetical protein
MNEILNELKKEQGKIGRAIVVISAIIWLCSLIAASNNKIDRNVSQEVTIGALMFINIGNNFVVQSKLNKIKELEEENRRLKNIVETSSNE